jgi:hypothetical protein
MIVTSEIVFPIEIEAFTDAFLPLIDPFSKSAPYSVLVTPAELLYPFPPSIRVTSLILLKLWSLFVYKVTVVFPVPVITAPVTANPILLLSKKKLKDSLVNDNFLSLVLTLPKGDNSALLTVGSGSITTLSLST